METYQAIAARQVIAAYETSASEFTRSVRVAKIEAFYEENSCEGTRALQQAIKKIVQPLRCQLVHLASGYWQRHKFVSTSR